VCVRTRGRPAGRPRVRTRLRHFETWGELLLRSGHVGYRKAHASRPSLDTSHTWRGPARSLASTPPLILTARATNEAAAGCFEASPSLADFLPLHLRSLLSGVMLASVGGDERPANAARRATRELSVQEFARAVRSFAATRAREHWIECAIPLRDFEAALAAAASSGRASFICLKCAVFARPAESQLHPAPRCIVAPLGAMFARDSAAERARRAVEKFRIARAAEGLGHYDLDCYVSKGRMVFTWRPIESPPAHN